MKKCFFIFALLTFTLLLSSCSQTNQLNQRLIVQGVAIDTKDDLVDVTMQVFDSENSQANEGNKIMTVNSSGETVLDAFNDISKKTGKEAIYSQNLVIIIGEECADKGINSVIDFFVRYYEVRPSVSVFVSKGKAKEMLDCEYEGKIVSCEEISSLATMGSLNAGGKSTNVVEVVNALAGDMTDPAIMALEISEDEHGRRPKSFGTAIFCKDKLCGYLSSHLNEGFLILSDDIKGGTFVMEIDDIAGKATMSFNRVKSCYSFDVSKETLEVFINSDIELNLYALDNSKERKLPSEYIEKTEAKANDILSSYCKSAIDTAVKSYKCDVLNIAKRLRLYHNDYYKDIQDFSTQTMANAEYNININTTIKNIGQEISPI